MVLVEGQIWRVEASLPLVVEIARIDGEEPSRTEPICSLIVRATYGGLTDGSSFAEEKKARSKPRRC